MENDYLNWEKGEGSLMVSELFIMRMSTARVRKNAMFNMYSWMK